MDKWEREPLTDDEVTAIYEAAGKPEDRLIVAFLADTGCRVNELIRSQPGWFDGGVGKYGEIVVPVEATSGKRAKTKKEAFLARFRHSEKAPQALFLGTFGPLNF